MYLRMVFMKNKKIFAGLALAAVALLAAGCSSAKSGESVKTAQARSSRTSKHYKEVGQNKTGKTNQQKDKQQNDDNNQDKAAAKSADQNNSQPNGQGQDNKSSEADSLNAKIAKDVVQRLGYPSIFNQSDFLFSETNGVITVSENHNSAHMKAENADPNVAPAVAHYQVVNGQLYYLNFDGTKSAVQ